MKRPSTLHRQTESVQTGQRGSVTLEVAILGPALLLLLGLVIVVGRISLSGGAIEAAARDAARQASIARDPTAATRDARSAAADTLTHQGLRCASLTVSVDTDWVRCPGRQPSAGLRTRHLCGRPVRHRRARHARQQDAARPVRQPPRPVPGTLMNRPMIRIGRRLGSDREAGSVTLFFVVAALALFAMVGLVVDGGTKIRAAQQADGLAEEAARAGGQQIAVPAAVRGNRITADPRDAVQRRRSTCTTTTSPARCAWPTADRSSSSPCR